jgi:hypothetical protein
LSSPLILFLLPSTFPLSPFPSFLEYLKKITVDLPQPSPAPDADDEDQAEPVLSVPFDKIVPVESSSASTAAKGLMQLLVLGTRDVVQLKQEEPFGEIVVRLK